MLSLLLALAAPAHASDGGSWYQVSLMTCPSPSCGIYVDPVNHGELTCPDGLVGGSCHVFDLDYRHADLGADDEADADALVETGRLLVRGSLVSEPDPNVYGGLKIVFMVTEAWEGISGTAPEGKFAREIDRNIACGTDPCPVYAEEILNTSRDQAIADLDFAPSDSSDAERARALLASDTVDGVIVAGRAFEVNGPDGTMPGRGVTEFYIRMGQGY
jgi:hypothetical protein